MANHSHVRRGWQATAILTLFFTAVAGAAAIGWWYARDSPPHQGPIVLISVDGLSPAALSTEPDSELLDEAPGIAALAADSVVFDRVYSHSSLLLPAYASLLAGRLPFEHGVRDDGGFSLSQDSRTLAELLRSRGFSTGAAVSSGLLHPDSGLAQGFSFYDAEPVGEPLPRAASRPSDERPDDVAAGSDTIDAAESWARAQEDQRYFLVIQVDAADADAAVARIAALLREGGSYERATVVLVGSRGEAGPDAALDEETLLVPLMVKQPDMESAGWRVRVPVQHIDLVPTLLDLVRAPIPGDLPGRSLKPLLTDEDGRISPQPVYAESLAAYFRLGGSPAFALTVNELRYVRGASEALVRLGDTALSDASAGLDPVARDAAQMDMTPLRATLDRLLEGRSIRQAAPIAVADRERLARAGYLPGLPPAEPGPGTDATLDDGEQAAVLVAHQETARLSGERNFAAAIRSLQEIARMHPLLADVHYQIGGIAIRTGNPPLAVAALREAAALRPDVPEIPVVLAMAMMQTGDLDDASAQAERAVVLAATRDRAARAAAHEAAARVALARHDAGAARTHAAGVQAARQGVPMLPFVEALLAEEAGDSEAALQTLQEVAAVLHQQGATLEGLHLNRARLLAQADRPEEAAEACREEIAAFPDSVTAYVALADIYRGLSRETAAGEVLDALVRRVPTREAYTAAARSWAGAGQRRRADRLRSEARARFRNDPLPATLARDTRR